MPKNPTVLRTQSLFTLIRELKFIVTTYGDIRASVKLCETHATPFREWAKIWTPTISWKESNGDRHHLTWEDYGFDEAYTECPMALCGKSGTEEIHFSLTGHADV